MPRIGFVLVAVAATTSCALAGCSALTFARSSRERSLASPQTLQFESVPSGADVRTGQGQTCQTPCSLALPVQSQSVTFAKNGFVPQTVQIAVDQPPPEHSFFSHRPPPTLAPNPVKAALLIAPPPPPPPPPPLQVIPQPAAPPARPAPPPRETIPWFPS
ncbi:MAG: PEGA domain-containing protein [Xanthobacteraceae bacterium]